MKDIKIKTWILWAVILFSVGLAADYFFWHLLLGHREEQMIENSHNEAAGQNAAPHASNLDAVDTSSFISESRTEATSSHSGAEQPKDNFLESLRACAPEVAAQAIATPEALLEYLQKSVGVQQEIVSIENYHLTLADGSARRVHVIGSDSSKNPQTKEIRLYKLDAEGYPDRVPLPTGATLESLLGEGKVQRHELRAELKLKDNSTINVEKHDQKVFEFQFNNHGRILSCRLSSCQCP